MTSYEIYTLITLLEMKTTFYVLLRFGEFMNIFAEFTKFFRMCTDASRHK
jgi:hypothetical protein